MKKVTTLRAGAEFKRTLLHGRRVEGKLLRCYYLTYEDGDPPLQVGYVVSSGRYNAVRRNRIKRLLRAAVAVEGPFLKEYLARKRKRLSLILYFKGGAKHEVERLKLRAIQEEVAAMCHAVIVQLEPKKQCQQP